MRWPLRSNEGMCSVTAQPSAHIRYRRAIERRALWMVEDAARELPKLSLEDALLLVHLYAERGSPKYEKAAMRWLERYLVESQSTLRRLRGDRREPCGARVRGGRKELGASSRPDARISARGEAHSAWRELDRNVRTSRCSARRSAARPRDHSPRRYASNSSTNPSNVRPNVAANASGQGMPRAMAS